MSENRIKLFYLVCLSKLFLCYSIETCRSFATVRLFHHAFEIFAELASHILRVKFLKDYSFVVLAEHKKEPY